MKKALLQILLAVGVLSLLAGAFWPPAEAPSAEEAPPAAGGPPPPVPPHLAGLQAHPDIEVRAVMTMIGEGRLGEAREQLQELTEKHPGDPAVLIGLSSVESETGLHDRAWEHLMEAEAAATTREQQEAVRMLKMTALATSRPGQAVRLLEEAVERTHGTNAGMQLMLAEALATRATVEDLPPAEEEAMLKRAEGLARQALKQHGGQLGGEPDGTLACVLWAQGNRPAAIRHFRAALEAGISNVDRALDIEGALGWLCYLEGDLDQAAAHFDKIVRLTDGWVDTSYYRALPKRENALVFREVLLGRRFSAEEMEAGLQRFRDLEARGVEEGLPEFRNPVQRMANMARLRAEGKPDEALGELIEILADEKKPAGSDWVRCFFLYKYDWPLSRSASLAMAGNVAREAGEYEMAVNLYERALKILPENLAAKEGLEQARTAQDKIWRARGRE